MRKRKYMQGFDGKSERETTWKTQGQTGVKINMDLKLTGWEALSYFI
jgi:hypothetical protein